MSNIFISKLLNNQVFLNDLSRLYTFPSFTLCRYSMLSLPQGTFGIYKCSGMIKWLKTLSLNSCVQKLK